MKDKKKFMTMMAGLGEVFDKHISDTLKDIYWKLLEPFDDIECEQMFNDAIVNCKFWPKPVELLNFIKRGKLLDPHDAWAMLMTGLERDQEPSDPLVKEAIRRIGGWEWLTLQGYDDLHWLEKRFIDHFNVMVETDSKWLHEGERLTELGSSLKLLE